MGQNLKPTSAAEKRRKSTFLFKASDELTIRLRRISMQTMILNNLIPFPMLKAAEEYEAIQQGKELADDLSKEERNEAISKLLNDNPGVLTKWNEFLQHYATVVAVEPRISKEISADENVLWVGELSGDELLAILNAEATVDETKEDAPQMNVEAAREFRGPAQRPDDPAQPAGDEVPVEAKLLDLPDREAIYS